MFYCFPVELLIGFYGGRGRRPVDLVMLDCCNPCRLYIGLVFLWRGRRQTPSHVYLVFSCCMYDCLFLFMACMN